LYNVILPPVRDRLALAELAWLRTPAGAVPQERVLSAGPVREHSALANLVLSMEKEIDAVSWPGPMTLS
jgi:hypothetical protein